MQVALKLADIAYSCNEVPVGAVIVDSFTNQIIGKGSNSTILKSDPTMHAEIIAIQEACKTLKSRILNNCYIYITLEPCAMCAAAISYARISRVYYGAQESKFGAIDSNIRIYNSSLSLFIPEVYEGIEQEKCASLLTKFFREKRFHK